MTVVEGRLDSRGRLRRRDRELLFLALRPGLVRPTDLLKLLKRLIRPVGLAGLPTGSGELEVQAAVFVGLEGGLQVRDGARGLAGVEVSSAQDRAGPQPLRIAADRALEVGDSLFRLPPLHPRLPKHKGGL